MKSATFLLLITGLVMAGCKAGTDNNSGDGVQADPTAADQPSMTEFAEDSEVIQNAEITPEIASGVAADPADPFAVTIEVVTFSRIWLRIIPPQGSERTVSYLKGTKIEYPLGFLEAKYCYSAVGPEEIDPCPPDRIKPMLGGETYTF